MVSPNTLEAQRPIGQRVRRADADRHPLPALGSWPHRGGRPVAREARMLGRLRRTKLGRKPVGRPSWRVDVGARPTRVTNHGGRAHTVYAFATKGVGAGRGRMWRRARIAATKGRVSS